MGDSTERLAGIQERHDKRMKMWSDSGHSCEQNDLDIAFLLAELDKLQDIFNALVGKP